MSSDSARDDGRDPGEQGASHADASASTEGFGRMREKLLKLKEKEKRKGVVYISRIPPKMKPRKLRSLLEPYGEIGRVYLAPQEEDPRKKAAKKSSGPQFSEGWVEFLDKTVAKDVAAMLNNQPMGGKKRSSHYSDLWSIKYLPKFKWDYLTEEAMYKRKVREQKMAIEISQAKRERDFYLQQVAQSKAVKAMEERRAKKRKAAEESGATGEGKESTQAAASKESAGEGAKRMRTHGQRPAKGDGRGREAVSSRLLHLLKGE